MHLCKLTTTGGKQCRGNFKMREQNKKVGTCLRSELGSFSKRLEKERIGTNPEKTGGEGEQRKLATLGSSRPTLGHQFWHSVPRSEFRASGTMMSKLPDSDAEVISKSQLRTSVRAK